MIIAILPNLGVSIRIFNSNSQVSKTIEEWEYATPHMFYAVVVNCSHDDLDMIRE